MIDDVNCDDFRLIIKSGELYLDNSEFSQYHLRFRSDTGDLEENTLLIANQELIRAKIRFALS
jgi:hypothetical protein